MCSTMVEVDAPSVARNDLADLAERVAPLALASDQRLAVPAPLQPVLPDGGLQRGWSVAVQGCGAWSLASALVAPAQDCDGWVVVVGAPAFGLVAAAGYGLRLDRMVVVDQPPTGRWAAVVAALVDAVDVVLVAPDAPVAARDARRLRARARERGALLVHLDAAATWPEPADVVLTVTGSRWEGLEDGHGHLRARRVAVTGSGRRLPGRPRRVELWLPDLHGTLAPAQPASGPVAVPGHARSGTDDRDRAGAARDRSGSGGAGGVPVLDRAG